MGNLRTATLVLGCSVLLARASFGDAPSASQQEMRSLDEQVQEIKSDAAWLTLGWKMPAAAESQKVAVNDE